MLTIERLDRLSDLPSIRDVWDRLAVGSRMRSYTWAKAWWENLGSGADPYVLLARCEGRIRGIFPLFLQRSAVRGRRLVMCGSGKACGDDLSILTTAEDAELVAHAMADWLAQATGHNRWDSIDLDGVQPLNAAMSHLQTRLEAVHHIPVTRKGSESCWAIDLSGGFPAYLEGLSKRIKRLVKNDMFARYFNSGRAVLRQASSLEEAYAMLDLTAYFHQSRWQERKIAGCFATPGFDSFLKTLLSEWWSERIAYMAMIEIDGTPAAGGFGYWGQDELAMYLVGMDLNAREHRPGWLLSVGSIQQAALAGKASFSFLRGDEEYKARLGAEPTAQERWIATSPRMVPQIRQAAIQRGIDVRDWFKKQRPAAHLH